MVRESIEMDMKTKHGGKIKIDMPNYISRAIGPRTRKLTNYCKPIVSV